jgi:hypothetical protein
MKHYIEVNLYRYKFNNMSKKERVSMSTLNIRIEDLYILRGLRKLEEACIYLDIDIKEVSEEKFTSLFNN